MILRDDLSLIGKINKTHGIKGELSMSFFDDDVAACIHPGIFLILDMDGIFTPFCVQAVRPRSHESLLIILDDFTDQDELAQCVGKEVYLSKADMPQSASEDDQEGFYAAQLIGFKAIDDKGVEIGEIIDIDDSTENMLFVVRRPDGKNCFIPIVDEFITDIDPDNTSIEFDLPEGMLLL